MKVLILVSEHSDVIEDALYEVYQNHIGFIEEFHIYLDTPWSRGEMIVPPKQSTKFDLINETDGLYNSSMTTNSDKTQKRSHG